MPTDLLTSLANRFGTDKGTEHHEAHAYSSIYHDLMKDKRHDPVALLEIGVNDPRFPGASLLMWDQYFTHPGAFILGLDINPPIITQFFDRVRVVQADQSKPQELLRVSMYMRNFDFIIDDGLHTFECQLNSYVTLLPMLASNGIYIIEDCHAKDCSLTLDFFRNLPSGYRDLVKKVEFAASDKLILITRK